jgi:4-oxalomesaconate hydratase
MAGPRNLLVVTAHPGDFVWRAGGALALAAANGGSATVLSLSYGERGEAGSLWKQEGQTVENVRRIRHDESVAAAAALGAEFRCLDLGDYPLHTDADTVQRVVDTILAVRPAVLLTHTSVDPYNPDHPVAFRVVDQARMLAAGANVASGFERVDPPEFLLFEPHQPELSGFTPSTFVDITPVYARKEQAMAAMGAQSYLADYYAELASRRANHARRASGDNRIRQAEAFQRVIPKVLPCL